MSPSSSHVWRRGPLSNRRASQRSCASCGADRHGRVCVFCGKRTLKRETAEAPTVTRFFDGGHVPMSQAGGRW